MIIVDASLATKLVVEEADSDAADRWLRNCDDTLAAPDLIAIEVAQAVVRRVNDRQTDVETGRVALGRWHDLLTGDGIELLRTEPGDVLTAAEIAMRLGHPVKDCIYLAAAIARDADFITCDAKFAARARVIYPGIKLFSDDDR